MSGRRRCTSHVPLPPQRRLPTVRRRHQGRTRLGDVLGDPPPPLPRAARAAGSLPRQMCCDCCLAVILLGSRCCGRLCGQLMCGCVGGGGIPLPGWSLRAPRAPAPHTSPLRFSRFPPELFLPRLRLSDPCSGVQLYLSMASPPPPPTATIATSTTGCVRTVGPVRSGTGAAATTARCSATSRYF